MKFSARSKVRKVAVAIADAAFMTREDLWENLNETARNEYFKYAIAAIGAMQGPTTFMVEEAQKRLPKVSRYAIIVLWKAMLEAAIRET